MNYEITYEKNPNSDDIQLLNDAIMEQARQKKAIVILLQLIRLIGKHSIFIKN